jgi:hypothetical protein
MKHSLNMRKDSARMDVINFLILLMMERIDIYHIN